MSKNHEKEFARQSVYAAKANLSFGDNDAVIVDHPKHFEDGKLDLVKFTAECDKLGYDVLQLENSVLSPFSMCLQNKIVIQNKSYRRGS